MPQIKTYESEHQRKWNRDSDDKSRSNVVEEEDQYHHYEHYPAEKVVLHSLGRELYQVAAVVERDDLYILRKDRAVQLFRLLFHAFQNRLRLFAGTHQDHTFHCIILIVEAELPQARCVSDHNGSDVLHQDRCAVLHGDHHVADVLGRVESAQAANVVELAALGVESATRVAVIRVQCGRKRCHGDSRAGKLGWINQHLILHRLAADGRHVRNARH